jgi:hypothetical protein
MTYEVVFDVWQRLPQLALGVVAALALLVVIGAGLWDLNALLPRWPLVLGLGTTCLFLQWLIVGEWPYVLAGSVVIGIIVALARASRAPADKLSLGSRRLIVCTFGMFMLVFAAFQGLPMIAAIDLDRRLMDGEAQIVEGPVRFVPFGGKTECLVVDGQRFCHSEVEVTAGYNRQRYLIGALRDGDQVRLSVIVGLIVRLEVARRS